MTRLDSGAVRGVLFSLSALLLSSGGSAPSYAASEGAATPRGPLPAAPANPSFTYPGYQLWDPATWRSERAPAAALSEWLDTHQQPIGADYAVPERYRSVANWVGNPDYTWKTENVSDPAVMRPLAAQGLRVDIAEAGGLVIFVAPKAGLADRTRKLPMLLVPVVLDRKDVFWAMNTLTHFRAYTDYAAKHGDVMIAFMVTEKSAPHPPPLAVVVDAAVDGLNADAARLYLDTSVAGRSGVKLAAIPGFKWTGGDGKLSDPDGTIEHVGPVPVLNIAGRWLDKPAPGIQAALLHGSNPAYDADRVVHGIVGARIADGLRFVHDHGTDDDPAVLAHFQQMGLFYRQHHDHGNRWLFFAPQRAIDDGHKLPLVMILYEVNDYEHYALSAAYAMYPDWFRLAAQGEVNLLVYAREGADTMDSAYDIIKTAERQYPIDPSRIYVTGHSHNGHLAREFAYRHPDMVAAVAPLGNSSGLAAPAYSHEAVVADDARIQAWSKVDMPVVTIGAATEVTSPHTIPSTILDDYDLFVEAWQRRLTASRIPMQSKAQIAAAEHSDDYVTRLFGLPNDGSALEVVDGVPHYIIDVKNVDGRKHLRIVGVDNMVHMAEPTMPMVAWTFMRRFARDQATGKVIERY